MRLDTTPPFDCTLADGAVIHVEANGEFSYTPGPGIRRQLHLYGHRRAARGRLPASSTGTVTFTFVDMIWYVDADAPAGGNGTSRLPFNTFTPSTLSGANGAGDLDNADDYIFVYNATAAITSGIELEAGQHLIGEHAGLSIPRNLNGNGSPTLLVPANAGAPPVINGGAGNSVTVTEALPAEIPGLTLGSLNAIDVTTDAALPAVGDIDDCQQHHQRGHRRGHRRQPERGHDRDAHARHHRQQLESRGHARRQRVDIIRAAGTLNLNFSGNTNIFSTTRRARRSSSTAARGQHVRHRLR